MPRNSVRSITEYENNLRNARAPEIFECLAQHCPLAQGQELLGFAHPTGHPCCENDGTCCLPGAVYCEDETSPHACVTPGDGCPPGYDWCLNCQCRDSPGQQCCVQTVVCSTTSDCASNECCSNTACVGCPGSCMKTIPGGSCFAGPTCPDGYTTATDTDCDGPCCTDPDRPICCSVTL